ncbi:unnamed protein product [Effrenium voratum]|nr:unnamed protein product [Effrenium voratum]
MPFRWLLASGAAFVSALPLAESSDGFLLETRVSGHGAWHLGGFCRSELPQGVAAQSWQLTWEAELTPTPPDVYFVAYDARLWDEAWSDLELCGQRRKESTEVPITAGTNSSDIELAPTVLEWHFAVLACASASANPSDPNPTSVSISLRLQGRNLGEIFQLQANHFDCPEKLKKRRTQEWVQVLAILGASCTCCVLCTVVAGARLRQKPKEIPIQGVLA